MPHFFAKFQQTKAGWVRHDTRIYLEDCSGGIAAGQCLGAIIGKNPGSAKAACTGWGPLCLDGDKMLPTVRNVLLKAYAQARKTPPPGSYLQVLNLFYICDHDFRAAKRAFERAGQEHRDRAESKTFPFVWFAWGGPSSKLDSLKDRFYSRSFAKAFFYAPASRKVLTGLPSKSDLAKHPQGMPHAPVAAYLASHL